MATLQGSKLKNSYKELLKIDNTTITNDGATATLKAVETGEGTDTALSLSTAQIASSVDGSAGTPAFTRSSDPNTGIFFPAADTIAFSEGGTEAMRIDSSGRVGIGTTSPGYNVQVEGANNVAIAARTSGGENIFYIRADTDAAQIGQTALSAKPIIFSQAGTERLRIDSSGNVIITSNKALISRGAGGVTSNSAVGEGALQANTTGADNTANGSRALHLNTTGDGNTANGSRALYSNTTGNYNTANGFRALYLNTSGSYNTANGYQALYSNTTGSYNTANGYQALYSNTTGYNNTANGLQALYSNTTGYNNTANGLQALYSNTTGNNNTANGYLALHLNTTGDSNTATGTSALYSNTTGADNTAIGFQAGWGTGANANTTGSNNTFIGNEAVGASATASNVITLGNGSIATLRAQVTTITSLSDRRDKKDIAPLAAGLDFVSRLNPVSFIWDTRDKAKVNVPDAGFIAQELLEVQEQTGITIPNLVSQENPEKLEAGYGTLIPVLVQAIRELKAKVESLEEKLK